MSTPESKEHAVKQKLAQLIKIGEVDDAARLAEAEGLLPEALELYKKAKDHRSRGRIYEKLWQLDKALDVYEEGKLYDLAARVAEKLGLKEKASSLYVKHQKAVGQYQFVR